MEQNNLHSSNKNSSGLRLKLIISILVTAVLFIAELYAIINQSDQLILLAAIMVLILIALYFVVDAALKLSLHYKMADEDRYDNIFRSEKASYLLLRKTFDDLTLLIERIDEEGRNASTEEIIAAQKKIGNIIISRNRDSMSAFADTNERILKSVLSLESKVEEDEKINTDFQEKFSKSFNEDVIVKQDKLFIELNNMEASLNYSLLELSKKVSGFQEEIERLAEHLENINTKAFHEIKKNVATIKDTPGMQEFSDERQNVQEAPLLENVGIDGVSAVGEAALEETVPEAKEPIIEEPGYEVSAEEELVAEEPVLEASVTEEPDLVEAAEDTTQEEASLASMPDLTDPNKAMTPEEIEALIAGTLDDIGLDLDPIEEEPQKEKPPMPDLSNPNKVMTPDEIAALLANI